MPTIFHAAERYWRADPGRIWSLFDRLISRGKSLEDEGRIVELEMTLMERDREIVALKLQRDAARAQAFGALEDGAHWHDRLIDVQTKFEQLTKERAET